MSDAEKSSAIAPLPPNEAERLEALRLSGLLDTPAEQMFDDLTALAFRIFGMPVVLISLIDQHRQFFKSAVGVEIRETSRDVSFCAHALLQDGPLIVPDMRLDERFRNNPFVTGETSVRFYAGAPLVTRSGHKLGTFCILDRQPHFEFGAAQIGELERFADLTSGLIDQRGLQRELRDANERFVLATKVSTDGIWDLNCLSGQLHLSARWNAILGLSAEDSIGKLDDWIERIHPYDYDRVKARWAALQNSTERSLGLEFRCRHEDGTWRWLITRVFCQRDRLGRLLRVTGSCTDVTATKMIDSLTGLHNRTSLLERLQWRIDRQADHRRSYGLLFVDLDGFKRVNDSLGHRRGDILLVEVARRLEQTVVGDPGSLVSRLGGDEFVVLVDEAEAAEDVLTIASLLEYLLSAPVDCDGQQVFISASVGVVFGGSAQYTRAEQVLEDADVAMYRAKMHGKAQNAVFSDTMREEARARLQIESELRTAMERGELEVWYQPKVRLSSGEIRGFEALLRWRHPVRGLVPPMEFIPIAEEIGLIGEIGRWVAGQAIAQLASWRKRGLVSPQATMAVNVSPRQFREANLLASLLCLLRESGVPASCFVLEVTENVLVEDSPALLALLDSIATSGIGLDLDDFGTGYSSLSYLHRFPFRGVKIDASFIGRMATDPKSAALVASIIALATSLKLRIIAEGVETEAQARHLSRMGCTAAQGFLFSPARPAEELDRYLKERTNPIGVRRRAEVFARPTPARIRPAAKTQESRMGLRPGWMEAVLGETLIRPKLRASAALSAP